MSQLAGRVVKFNHKEVAFRKLQHLGIIMRRGDIFEVDGAALRCMEAIREAPSCDLSLAHLIASEYGTSYSTALQDLADLISVALELGIILENDHPASCTVLSDRKSTFDIARESAAATVSPRLACWELASKQLIPLKCKLNLTNRCNIGCHFCYNGKRPGLPGGYNKRDELSVPEIGDLFEQLDALGTAFLSLTGGEPLTRSDILDILELADYYSFGVEILSNGTLLSPILASKIAQHRVQIVVVPIFGAAAHTHDKFVQMRGAFDKTCLAVRELAEAGIEVGVRCAINADTFDEWRQQREMIEEWGVRYMPHVQVHLSADGKVDARWLRLTEEQLQELFKAGLELNSGYGCEVSRARLDIMPNGDVALCSLMTEPLGNIRTAKIRDIWFEPNSRLMSARDALGRWSQLRKDDNSIDDRAYRCSADALFDNGDLAGISSEALRVIRHARQASAET